MTVFIASLNLPFTVNFRIHKEDQRRSLNSRASRSRTDDSIDSTTFSLFVQGLAGSQTLPTPAIPTKHEEFFLSNGLSSRSSQIQIAGNYSAIGPLEPPSPSWGPSILRHAGSHAELPPISILQRQLDNRATRVGVGFVTDSRKQSHERKLNSAPWTIEPAEHGNGGLRSAVHAASEAGYLKEKIWVGTLGIPTDFIDQGRKADIEDKLSDEKDCIPVFPTDKDFDGHYSHYCKTILSPVFHYQIPDNPKSKAYEDHSWAYYVKVNQAFADRIISNWKRGDIVWVHDYHLLLVPAMIREKIPDAQIGFFMHVAFPSSEVFRCLGMRIQLLEGMLGANLIGFQTQEYCLHFLSTCNRLLCIEATTEGVELADRFVNVATFPIGIDPNSLNANRNNPEMLKWLQRIRIKYGDKKLIVARDKLDHVRGVRQKLLAYELFLNKYPHLKEKVVLIQVITSTTEQAELNATVSDIVTRINALHSTLAHQPLVFLKQDIEYSQYLALLTAADALMITSLREGMNLTSHEYVFCQDGRFGDKQHGALILSEFTGSAAVFGGNELSVNPWNYRQCAEAIKTALDMSSTDRESQWDKLIRSVMHHTAEHWLTSFLDHLARSYKEHSRRDTLSIPRLSVNDLAQKYQAARRRLFILDYEGTLAAYGSSTSIIFTSPQRTLDTLNDLLFDEKNIVYVMSSRKPEELDRLFRRVPRLGLIAENGCFLKEFGAEEWTEVADINSTTDWKESVEGIIQYYKDRTEGSWIEERHHSIAFHYADAKDPQSAARLAGDCANHINDACQSQNIHAVTLDHALLVESKNWTKGTAASLIFERLREKYEPQGVDMPEFLMVAGDARDDEVMYRWANKLGKDKVVRDVTTVNVSSRNTEAMTTLTQGVTGVLSALQRLAVL